MTYTTILNPGDIDALIADAADRDGMTVAAIHRDPATPCTYSVEVRRRKDPPPPSDDRERLSSLKQELSLAILERDTAVAEIKRLRGVLAEMEAENDKLQHDLDEALAVDDVYYPPETRGLMRLDGGEE